MTHANICNIDFKSSYQCWDQLAKFWRHNYFLEDIGPYVYKLNKLSHEETYMNRKLVTLFEYLGFIYSVSPSERMPRKQNKWFIETRLQVEVFRKSYIHDTFDE